MEEQLQQALLARLDGDGSLHHDATGTAGMAPQDWRCGTCVRDWTCTRSPLLLPPIRGHRGLPNPRRTAFQGTVALPLLPETSSAYYSLLLEKLFASQGRNSHVHEGCEFSPKASI